MSQILPPKKDVALALLERASVFVHLDPRGAGVVVPVQFKKQPRLVLQIGLNMAVPIPDLRLDDQGLSCTLSFNRSLFHCVPWSGIFALVGEDGRGMVWPDDVPQEIAREMSPQKDDGKTDAAGAPIPQGGTGGPTGIAGGRKRPQMSLVSSPGADPKRPSKRGGGAAGKTTAGDRDARRKRDDAAKPTLFKVDAEGKPSKPSKPTQIGRGAGKGKVDERRADEKPIGARGSDASPSAGGLHGSAKPGAGAGVAGSSSSNTGSQPRAPSAAPAGSSGAPPSSPPGKRSPKRELPPYLRVVK